MKKIYNRTPDGKFAKKSLSECYSIKDFHCEAPINKVMNGKDGRVRYKISKKYPFRGTYIQLSKDRSIDTLSDTFIALDAENLSGNPFLETYQIEFWGDVTEDALPAISRRYEVTDGGFKVIRQVPYEVVVTLLYGAASAEDLTYNQVGPDNKGCCNIGKGNFGHNNIGLENYGEYNKGIRLAGLFNTKPSGFFMFNRPVVTETPWWKMSELFPSFLLLDFKHPFNSDNCYERYTLRESFERAIKQDDWAEEYAKLLAMPNFDYAIFEEITGISKEELEKAYKDWAKRTKKTKKRK